MNLKAMQFKKHVKLIYSEKATKICQNLQTFFDVTWRVVHQICNWAKYRNKHSSRSIKVINMFFCQSNSLIGGSFELYLSCSLLGIYEL